MDAKTTRIQKTNMGGFDQLLLLGQKYLNESFATMYRILRKDDPKNPMLTFGPEGRSGKVIDCIIEAPKIELSVEGAGYDSLIFTMIIRSGKLVVYKELAGNDQTPEIPMNGWKIPFRVPLRSTAIAKDSAEYAQHANRFSLPNGTFTMHKIFLDCTNAESTRRQEGDYNGFDWDKTKYGPAAFANWSSLVDTWIAYCGDKGHNVLGLAANPDANVGTPATFPPTWCSRQTYPFIDPAVSGAVAKNSHEYNALVYLMMSSTHTAPSPALLAPTSAGTWLVPDSKIVGTYALSRNEFWHRWFLPLAYKFCGGVALNVDSPKVKVDGHWDIEWSEQFFWSVGGGIPGKGIPGFNMDKFSDGGVNTSLLTDEQKPTDTGSFHVGMVTSTPVDGQDQSGSAKPHGVFRVTCSNDVWQWYTVKFEPGSNIITIRGLAKISAKANYEGSDTPAWPTYETADIKVDWTVKLEISSVQAGGVTVNVKGDEQKTFTKNVDGHTLKGTIIPYYIKDYAETYFNSLTGAFDTNFTWFKNQLANSLKNQGQLFLPGNGALLFKNGTFNANGDLLLEVHFDGIGF